MEAQYMLKYHVPSFNVSLPSSAKQDLTLPIFVKQLSAQCARCMEKSSYTSMEVAHSCNMVGKKGKRTYSSCINNRECIAVT